MTEKGDKKIDRTIFEAAVDVITIPVTLLKESSGRKDDMLSSRNEC